jgi:PIN domain nuclease of toxin-antitoxin system
MKVLLDTHAFLYFISGSPDLSTVARITIESPNNERLLSVASLWEIAIKVSIQKLQIGMTMSELVKREVHGNAIQILAIEADHLDRLSSLPFHHKDPFDDLRSVVDHRLMIAQSFAANIPLISKDSAFGAYGVKTIW